MGSTVEIYVKHPGPGQELAHRVAEALDLARYFYNGDGYVLPVDARRWVGAEGWGHLLLGATDPDLARGTAFAPYEYELSLEFRGPRERFGRAVFDRLRSLGLPLAYGDYGRVFADFLPGRGLRDFSPDTDAEEEGRPLWFEPRLHGDPTTSWPPEAAAPAVRAGAVTVFETDGLLQLVPVADARWIRPVASALSTVGARDVGLLVGAVLRTAVRSVRDDRETILAALASARQLSIEDFARRSVSIEIRADGEELVAIPHAPHRGAPAGGVLGPAVDELVRTVAATSEPEALGELVLGSVGALRSHVPT